MSTHLIYTSAISSSESWGEPSFGFGITIYPIFSFNYFGSPRFNWFPISIPSVEILGIPSFITNVIYSYNVLSAEIFGSPKINFNIVLGSISSIEDIGYPSLIPGPVTIFPTGVASAGTFGSPHIIAILKVDEIQSSETFGWVKVLPGALVVPITGVSSGEEFGSGLLISIISNSISYLPVYNQEQDFFKMICEMVDYVRTKDYLQWEYNDDQALLDKVEEVIPIYHDTEAILAYYKLMIKPIVGTKTVLEYLGKLVEFDESDIQEWFEFGGNVWHFKVFLGRVAAPIEDFEVLYDTMYDLIMEYKNERSYLQELHIYIALYVDLFVGMIPLCGEDVTIYDMAIMVSNVQAVNAILSGETIGIPRFPIRPLRLTSEEHIGSPALNGMVPFSITGGESFGITRFPARPSSFVEEAFGSLRFPIFPTGIPSRETINTWTRIGSA